MTEYSFITGLLKSGKNWLVLWVPAIIAFLTSVPVEYGAVAGFLVYLLKNYIQNK